MGRKIIWMLKTFAWRKVMTAMLNSLIRGFSCIGVCKNSAITGNCWQRKDPQSLLMHRILNSWQGDRGIVLGKWYLKTRGGVSGIPLLALQMNFPNSKISPKQNVNHRWPRPCSNTERCSVGGSLQPHDSSQRRFKACLLWRKWHSFRGE